MRAMFFSSAPNGISVDGRRRKLRAIYARKVFMAAVPVGLGDP
jgi:hypothetical protein